MRCSSALPCAKRSRAAAPWTGILEDGRVAALQLPGREEERPVDVRHQLREIDVHLPGADERGRRRVGEVQPLPVGPRLRVRQRRPLRPAGVLIAQLRLRRAIVVGEAVALRSSLSRLATTSVTRDASGTCTVGRLYCGAIFTAVCCLLVVAPPMRSGSVRCRAAPSPTATNTISSSDGVIRPLSPTMSTFRSTASCRILSQGTITPRSMTS